MKSFLTRFLGGSLSDDEMREREDEPARSEAVAYGGFVIMSSPQRDGSHWRLAGVILKESGGGQLERTFVRADTFMSREDADDFAIRKGKQIIDEQGERLFADGAPQGHV